MTETTHPTSGAGDAAVRIYRVLFAAAMGGALLAVAGIVLQSEAPMLIALLLTQVVWIASFATSRATHTAAELERTQRSSGPTP